MEVVEEENPDLILYAMIGAAAIVVIFIFIIILIMCCVKRRAEKKRLENSGAEEHDSTEESVMQYKLKSKGKPSQLRYKKEQKEFLTVVKRPRKKKYHVNDVISEKPSEFE